MMEERNLNIELIARCLQNTASEDEKKELLRWIDESRENELTYFELKDLYDAGNWKRLKIEANTPQNWDALKSRLSTDSGQLVTKNGRMIQLMKYAAVLIIGALLSFFVFRHDKSKTINPELASAVVTGVGERTRLVLPDGTHIWVNSCSSVSYRYDYGTNSRNVYLSGEAYFKVAKNKALPFIVHASGIQVKALGTSFNVTAYDNDNELSTVLLEGSVSFGNVEKGNAEIIKPGQKITYSKVSQTTSIENVNAENYVAWSNGETRFEHLTMEEITKRLQRTYHVTFVLQNERIKKMHFTGTFRNYESLDQILRVINTNTNLSFKIVRDTVYLK